MKGTQSSIFKRKKGEATPTIFVKPDGPANAVQMMTERLFLGVTSHAGFGPSRFMGLEGHATSDPTQPRITCVLPGGELRG